MTLQVPVGFALVFHPLFHVSASREWGVTCGYDLGDAVGTNTEIITEIDQSFRSTWSSLLDASLQFQPARAQIGNDGPPLSATSTEPAANASRGSTDTPPPNVAVGITKRTEFGGRQYRGRFYFPGLISEAEVDEVGVITPARQVSIQTAASAWLSGLAGSVLQPWPVPMVLLHGPPKFGGPIPAPTPVSALTVQRVVRTQRRRLRG